MNQNSDSDECNASEEKPFRFSSRLRLFENLNKSEPPTSKLLNKKESEPIISIRSNVSHENENNLDVNKESRQELENPQSTPPPVPPRRLSQQILPPVATLTRTVKNTNVRQSESTRNSFANVIEKNVEPDQIDVSSPIPSRINDTFSILSRSTSDVHRSKDIRPTPRARTRSNSTISRTTSCFTLNENQPSIPEVETKETNIPLRSAQEFNVMFKQPSFPEVVTKEANIPLRSPQEFNVIEERAGDPKGKNNLIKNRDVFHQNNELPVNILPLRPKSAYSQEVSNKGAIKRNQTMSYPTRVMPANLATSTVRRSHYENFPIEQQNAPPLPPKSLTVRQMMSPSQPTSPHSFSPRTSLSEKFDFRRRSSNSDAIKKLNELKFIFSSTSGSQSDKYNKSILLLIDIMIEAIHEKSSNETEFSDDENSNAWYSNIKDFVHNETEEYIRENEFSDLNRNIPYDKLFSKMMPKFIENYVTTDNDLHQNRQSDEEEDYEKVLAEEKGKEKENEELQYLVTSETVTNIIEELKQTERNHLLNLETFIKELIRRIKRLSLAEDFSTEMVPIIEDLLTMQRDFLGTLEENGNNLFLLLKTFLDFEDLFALYVEFFSVKMKTLSDKSISENMDELKPSKDLSELLLSRLTNYRLLIKNITKESALIGELNEKANDIDEMLTFALEKCNNAIQIPHVPVVSEPTDVNPSDTRFLKNLMARGSYISPEYGLFLLRNYFKVDKNRFTVFLFEKQLVFTKEISNDNLIFKNSLKLNQLVLVPEGKNKKILKLKDYLKSKSSDKEVIIKLEARSEKIQKTWRTEINKCLWAQLIQEKEESKTKPKETSL